MQPPTPSEIRTKLEHWLSRAVAAVDPYHATRRALHDAPAPVVPPGIIALGKAAPGMARAVVDWLSGHGLAPMSGIVVADHFSQPLHPALQVALGDHPVPGEQSFAAAEAIAQWISGLPPAAPVHVFLSGGTSSLIAAPIDGLDQVELSAAFELLHALGLDIETMNGLRRRLTRWSNGRLANALGERSVHAWVISDVVGNDPAIVGSGPLIDTGVPRETVVALLADPRSAALSPKVRDALRQGTVVKIADIPHRIVADGLMAANALGDAARRDGMEAVVHPRPIVAEAAAAGQELARWIQAEIRRNRLPRLSSGMLVTPVPRTGVVHIWHSETTVSLPDDHGLGGRAQQFALSVARHIAGSEVDDTVTVMIAATDGRDGPTDAAGAVVNAATLVTLESAGVDVAKVLSRCDAYPALDKVGALLRTGRSGTNVADLVVVWMWNWY